MTREEAIKILEEEAEFLYGGDEPYNKIAFDMAIEALSEKNIARDIATILENEQDMRVMLQVVRCKDCRYFKKIVERSDSGLCHRDIVASAWKENGYCSRGERREP